MDETELTEYVVRQLADADDPNEILLELCNRMGWSWPESEAFLTKVEAEQAIRIARRQFPMIAILALGIFLGGLALSIYAIYSLLESWNAVVQARQTIIDGVLPPLTLLGHLKSVFDSGVTPFYALFTGIAMVLGSLLGMRKAWASLLG